VGDQEQHKWTRILETQGLLAALEDLMQETMEAKPILIHLEADADVEKLLSKGAQEAVFSIAAESIANACKHARADNINIRLYRRGTDVIAEVQDDGVGFDVGQVKADLAERRRRDPELSDLWQRAAAVGGEFRIQSTPGKGTKVTVTVPVEDK
jgi:NarL family two-component system sensor histidine kinase LiaS